MCSLGGAADDAKLIHGIKKLTDVPEEHMREVAAAHAIRALVFQLIKDARETLKMPIYYTDDEIAGFQGYDEPDEQYIQEGLVFCINDHLVPGKLFTRWGVWHFAQQRSSIDGALKDLGIWKTICSNIIAHKDLELKPCGRPASLGGERMYAVMKVGDMGLPNPFLEDVASEQVSRLRIFGRSLKRCVSMPCMAVGSALASGSEKVASHGRLRSRTAIKLYHPPNRYDSLPYTTLLRDSEVYWLQLSQAYKRHVQKK